MSFASWRKDEGTSDRKDCICLVFYSIIYTLLSVVVAPAVLISVLWVVTLLILAPDPGWSTPSGSRRKTGNPGCIQAQGYSIIVRL